MMFLDERIDLCEVARMMFDRYLTNAAGGNITVKVSEELFLMTPTLMSQAKFCRLTPEDILVVDKHGNIYEGKGKLTREFNMHMAAYEALPEAGAVIHGHAKESMVFASLGMQMPNLTEATQKLGDIATLEFAPATTKELAKIVREHLLSRRHPRIRPGDDERTGEDRARAFIVPERTASRRRFIEQTRGDRCRPDIAQGVRYVRAAGIQCLRGHPRENLFRLGPL